MLAKPDNEIAALDQQLPESVTEALSELAARFPGRVVFTTSLGKEDQALTALIATSGADIRVVTLDTGRLFPETYDILERTRNKYKLPIEVFLPDTASLESFVNQHGVNSFYRSIELRKACCEVRKIQPLKRALKDAEIWVTGLRAGQSDNRQALPRLQRDPLTRLIKYNPLVNWSEDTLESFIDEHHVPVNPLHARGFPSIGCAPCTRAIEPGEHPRAGRWWWESSKKECGLHQHNTELKQA